MTPTLQRLLSIVAIVPALLLPRGIALSWCLCDMDPVSSCCVEVVELSCCSTPPQGEGDCSSCETMDVEFVSDVLALSQTGGHELQPALQARPLDTAVRPTGPSGRSSHLRAPPASWTPVALRPGALPLRL